MILMTGTLAAVDNPARPHIYQLMVRHFGNIDESRMPHGTMAENGCGKFDDINDAKLCHHEAHDDTTMCHQRARDDTALCHHHPHDDTNYAASRHQYARDETTLRQKRTCDHNAPAWGKL